MIYLVIFFGCFIITVLIYNYLSGKNLIKDYVHFQILKRSSLSTLDEEWNKSDDKSDIVVSLTTIPERINHLELTIKSLLKQKRLSKIITLNIPFRSFRNNEEYVLPDWLINLKSVRIVRVEIDYGPSTKFIPAIETHKPDQRILVVDDDNIYPPGYIAGFEKAAISYEEVILAASGWRVPKDLIDKPTTLRSNIFKIPPTPVPGTRVRKMYPVDIIQGYSAYLIKPKFFNLESLKDFSKAPNKIRFVDDVWISAKADVDKYVIPMKRYCYPPFFSKHIFKPTSLAKINNHNRENYQDRNNSVAIRYFKEKWLFNNHS